jgi:hypothetical protein
MVLVLSATALMSLGGWIRYWFPIRQVRDQLHRAVIMILISLMAASGTNINSAAGVAGVL